MNLAILHPKVQQFIAANFKTAITKLVLKGSPFAAISIQELANQLVAKQKSEKKLPTWFQTENIYYPPKINIEQTSSEITAAYKTTLLSGNSIIDITGGFGVDCFYFAKQFKKVVYCEINAEVSKIVAHNIVALKQANSTIFSGDGLEYLRNSAEKFDCIYIDPSRRNELKGKVFLLEDCLPNVPKNIDFLFTKTKTILLKNSPILDITSAINELKFVKEIHVVAIKNEVKEVLFLLEKDFTKKIEIKTINIQKDQQQKFNFKFQATTTSTYSKPLLYLYEPNPAILKSGGFHEISQQITVFKLQQHAHLYTSNKLVDFPGRRFKIEATMPYDKKKIKKLVPENKANITTRNFPKSVAIIRKETNIKEGGDVYLFFTTNLENKPIVILATKV